MFNDLIYCLNATVPIFLIMLLGVILAKQGLMPTDFIGKLNSFVFKVPLPILLFNDMRRMNIAKSWSGSFVVFCFLISLASIMLVIALSYLLPKDKRDVQGELVQASYRSSCALLGIVILSGIYKDIHVAPLMIVGAVPLYNLMAVIILSFYKPGQVIFDRIILKQTFINILKNPMIISIAIGFVWSIMHIPTGFILDKTLVQIGDTAAPLGLLALGAAFDFNKAKKSLGIVSIAAFIKLIGLTLIFIPIAILLGYRNSELVAVLILCSSPTTVSAYVMAKAMDHKGIVSSGTVMLSTILCPFTMTFYLFILKTNGFI